MPLRLDHLPMARDDLERLCHILAKPRAKPSQAKPSLHSFVEPQHGQLVAAAITTGSRGKCSGNGFRAGRLRSKDLTTVEGTARSIASSLSVASASSSSNCISSCSMSRSLRSERAP